MIKLKRSKKMTRNLKVKILLHKDNKMNSKISLKHMLSKNK